MGEGISKDRSEDAAAGAGLDRAMSRIWVSPSGRSGDEGGSGLGTVMMMSGLRTPARHRAVGSEGGLLSCCVAVEPVLWDDTGVEVMTRLRGGCGVAMLPKSSSREGWLESSSGGGRMVSAV